MVLIHADRSCELVLLAYAQHKGWKAAAAPFKRSGSMRCNRRQMREARLKKNIVATFTCIAHKHCVCM